MVSCNEIAALLRVNSPLSCREMAYRLTASNPLRSIQSLQSEISTRCHQLARRGEAVRLPDLKWELTSETRTGVSA